VERGHEVEEVMIGYVECDVMDLDDTWELGTARGAV
jgi:hypothetical protein